MGVTSYGHKSGSIPFPLLSFHASTINEGKKRSMADNYYPGVTLSETFSFTFLEEIIFTQATAFWIKSFEKSLFEGRKGSRGRNLFSSALTIHNTAGQHKRREAELSPTKAIYGPAVQESSILGRRPWTEEDVICCLSFRV